VDLLDQICNKSPLILMRDDTHSYWINSIALKLCQLDASTEVPAGGVISIDSSGKLNGSVAETAMNLV
jgi:predicted amidohydrolase YtcJ